MQDWHQVSSPFCCSPTFSYNETPAASWIQGRCFCCTSQTQSITSWLVSGVAIVSTRVPISLIRELISCLVSSNPLVVVLQYFASSKDFKLLDTCISVRGVPDFSLSSDFLASVSSKTFFWTESKWPKTDWFVSFKKWLWWRSHFYRLAVGICVATFWWTIERPSL